MSSFLFRILWMLINVQLIICVKDGLYETEDDDVFILNSENFSAVLKRHSDIVWVVEFYNSWCGHCIQFAPRWKEVALYFKDWQDMVMIAAVDCSQSTNLDICRKYDIAAYPTLKMFPPTSVAVGKTEVIGSQDLLFMKNTILEFMVKNAPRSWPHLQPLEKIEDIWREKKDNHKHVLLIFEEPESLVGSQVIIDLRKLPDVLVRRMLKDTVVKYGISKFPSLYKLLPDSTYSMMAVGSKMMADDRAAFVQTIKNLAEGSKDEQDSAQHGQDTKPGVSKKPIGSVIVLPPKTYNSSVVSMQDLESALHYSFRQEVAIRKYIENERLQSLHIFVEVLLKYFPGRKPVIGFLNRVSDMLMKLKASNLTGEEWINSIDRLQDKENYLPAVVKWESCQGSTPRYRGYPCSMWTLFHTLTVAAYNQEISARHKNPHDVLIAIRGYMKNFFGCQECATNFQQMAQSLEEEVHTHKDSVLWLWSAHNKANKRLQGDASEDPQHPKIEFPSDKTCPQCYTTPPEGSSKHSWDMTKVLQFLVTFYSEKNIVSSKNLQESESSLVYITKSPPEKAEFDWWEKKLLDEDLKQFKLLQERKEKFNNYPNNKILLERNSSSIERLGKSRQEGYQFVRLLGLNHIDFSLCVGFYIISTVIIIMLYHHFIVRRRMVFCRSIASKIPL